MQNLSNQSEPQGTKLKFSSRNGKDASFEKEPRSYYVMLECFRARLKKLSLRSDTRDHRNMRALYTLVDLHNKLVDKWKGAFGPVEKTVPARYLLDELKLDQKIDEEIERERASQSDGEVC